MWILVLNCGSATIKHRLYRATSPGELEGAGGTIEVRGDYQTALTRVLDNLAERPDIVAHRVVHGGRFRAPLLLDRAAEAEIEALAALAPLHNRPALAGIAAARRLGVPAVAVFDTAFHQSLPERAWRYALPPEVGPDVRRFGFHGLSHQYVTERYALATGSPTPTIISLHLGGGCSAAAIQRGVSIDTSMGWSPMEGLVMGTRSGDVDPAIVLYLLRSGRSTEEVDALLNRASGLIALAGTADMRAILARDDAAAGLALEIFCYRIRKYIGAYLAALEGADAIVFTGGIGENAPEVRRRCGAGFEWAGLVMDEQRNRAGAGRISTDSSKLHAWVIPTDEELMIARAALTVLGGSTP